MSDHRIEFQKFASRGWRDSLRAVVQKVIEDICLPVQPGSTEATTFVAIGPDLQRNRREIPLSYQTTWVSRQEVAVNERIPGLTVLCPVQLVGC